MEKEKRHHLKERKDSVSKSQSERMKVSLDVLMVIGYYSNILTTSYIKVLD